MKNPLKIATTNLTRWKSTLVTSTLAALCAVSLQFAARAQSDNFDDGDDVGWVRVNTLQPFGAMNTYSFPDGPFGKGYRVQCTSVASLLQACGDCGTARAFIYRTNIYTDFYVSTDLINWNNSLNQAMVLLARGNGLTNVLSPCPLPACPPGFATVNGYVCNYDCNQSGVGAGDELGGQFQINRVTGEAPSTIATVNLTLIPGKSYRMVMKGVGTLLTAQVYDLEDLSAPLATIQATDDEYPEGVSGLVTFSRDGTTSDMTVDNYLAAVSDPNTDIAPAIRHPIAGTPQVLIRTPTNRFANFHPTASGISFTANTFSTNEIDSSQTKLYLNNVDRSSSLSPLPANGTNVSFTTSGGTLEENRVYAARIEVANASGGLKSTNTFWFDTFTDAYLTNAPVKTVEAEDYNYGSGQFQLDPIPVSGFDTNGLGVTLSGVGYADLAGTPDVDYHDNRTSPEGGWNDYRVSDSVGTQQGNRQDLLDQTHPGATPPWGDTGRLNDTQRQKYAVLGVPEYQVGRNEPGEWLNFTRVFANTNYYVFLRAGSAGVQELKLDLVNGDITTTNQSTTPLGSFLVQNQLARFNYRYTPLVSGGAPVVVRLSGTNTIRLTFTGTPVKDMRLVLPNYLLFVPTDAGLTFFDNFNDGNDSSPAPAWVRFNPIGTGSWSFPGGNSYRIQSAASPDPVNFGQGRAGSLKPGIYADFYHSVDVVGWDDTIRQIFGVLGRVGAVGPGTTTGYIFSYDRGNPASSTAGDMDIVRLDGEVPTSLTVVGEDSIHLETNKTYRFAFMGVGSELTGKVYELPNTFEPVITMTATDSTYDSGQAGLVVANNASPTFDGPADATFDNYLATTAEPRLTVVRSGSNVQISWPTIPFVLERTSSLDAAWTSVTTGITLVGDRNVYSTPATGTQYYRLRFP